MDDTRTNTSSDTRADATTITTGTNRYPYYVKHSHIAATGGGRYSYSHTHDGGGFVHSHGPEANAYGSEADAYREADTPPDANGDTEALGPGNLGAGIPVANTV